MTFFRNKLQEIIKIEKQTIFINNIDIDYIFY